MKLRTAKSQKIYDLGHSAAITIPAWIVRGLELEKETPVYVQLNKNRTLTVSFGNE